MTRLVSVALCCLLASGADIAQSESRATSPSAHAYARATSPWPWDLPSDHRSHPEFALEWWYLTGRLVDAEGRDYGYQATFFRQALTPALPEDASPFRVRDVIVFHGAVTDVASETFTFEQDASRAISDWAGASTERLDVHLFERRLRQAGEDTWELDATIGDWTLDLDLSLDGPVVLHGDGGLSRKGEEPGQASHYVTRPRMPTSGHLVRPDGRRLAVQGLSWLDQEFGSSQLSEDQVGWDWFSARLDDGSSLMIYLLRTEDGGVSPTSSGTWTSPEGASLHLTLDDIALETTDHWTSPDTGVRWPSGWTIRVPRVGLELRVRPMLAAQEMATRETTGVLYWEGLSRYEGTREGSPVTGHGHVELVGYGGAVFGLRSEGLR